MGNPGNRTPGQSWRLFRWVFRFLAGRPLDGWRRTDSSFTRRGTRAVIAGVQQPSRWSMLAGWHRATVRVGCLVAAAAWSWWWAALRTGMLPAAGQAAAVAVSVTSGAVTWAAWTAVHVALGWKHHRAWVGPLHATLGPLLGHPVPGPVDYLTVPRDFSSDSSAGVRVDLPPNVAGVPQLQAQVAAAVTARLGLSDPDVTWRQAGARPHVIFKAAPQPPRRVTLADVAAELDNGRDDQPLLGLGRRAVRVRVKLDDESPHVLFSAGSGAGKSNLARVLIAQALRNGGRVVICDVKRVSHRWVKGHPQVDYHRDIGEIHDALIALKDEGLDRYRVIDAWEGDDDSAPVGQRTFLVMEEMNATITRLQHHWDKLRDKDDPKRSPAVEALGDILFMGRQAKIHVIAIAQMATARALGGPEVRENFATRILGRYTLNAWRMLVPEVWPAPKSSRRSGRVQVVIAGHAEPTQVLYLTDAEARQVAGPGIPRTDPGPRGTRPGRLHLVDMVPAQSRPAEPIGLRQAAMTVCASIPGKDVDGRLECLRSARKRDPEFPAPAAQRGKEKLYDPDALARWARNRARSIETEEPAG